MNTLATITISALFAAVLAGCSSSTSVSSASVSEVATNYTKLNRITAGAVLVNPELAMLCVGISKEAVDATRKQFGPHANTAILVYMNDLAAGAFRANATAFPVGAVIVKQKTMIGYTEGGKEVHRGDNGVGGMIKRQAGYDSKHGDWEYFYFEDVTRVESGRISSCVQCHESAKGNDYVFGSWNKKGG